MCGLCGIFGVAEHWSDSAGGSGASASGAGTKAERLHRVRIANAALEPFGLKVADWMNRLTLSSLTGKSAVIDSFGALWPTAERLSQRPCDPLDGELIARYERARDDYGR
jgi:hypothetical protein